VAPAVKQEIKTEKEWKDDGVLFVGNMYVAET
jgi:hypothetical protein